MRCYHHCLGKQMQRQIQGSNSCAQIDRILSYGTLVVFLPGKRAFSEIY